MGVLRVVVALAVLGPLHPGEAVGQRPPSSARPEPAAVNVTVRYSRERIKACEPPKERHAGPKFTCTPKRQAMRGTARLEFLPLPDEKRRILGPDQRRASTVVLEHGLRIATKTVKLSRGPWRVEWKGTDQAVRADIETQGSTLVLSSVTGTCEIDGGRCKHDPKPVRRRLEYRTAPVTAREPSPRDCTD
jgi:hypothetical protein